MSSNLTPPTNPTFRAFLRALQPTDYAIPKTWDDIHQAIIENEANVESRIKAIENANLNARVGVLESTAIKRSGDTMTGSFVLNTSGANWTTQGWKRSLQLAIGNAIQWPTASGRAIGLGVGSDGHFVLISSPDDSNSNQPATALIDVDPNANAITMGLVKAQSGVTVLGGTNINLYASSSLPIDAGDIVFRTFAGAVVGRIYSSPTGTGIILESREGFSSDFLLDITGKLNLGSTLLVKAGGESMSMSPGVLDHAYLSFYARSATPATRSAYFGFPSAGALDVVIKNEISGGNIQLNTTGTGKLYSNGAVVQNILKTSVFAPNLNGANRPGGIVPTPTWFAGSAPQTFNINVPGARPGDLVNAVLNDATDKLDLGSGNVVRPVMTGWVYSANSVTISVKLEEVSYSFGQTFSFNSLINVFVTPQ